MRGWGSLLPDNMPALCCGVRVKQGPAIVHSTALAHTCMQLTVCPAPHPPHGPRRRGPQIQGLLAMCGEHITAEEGATHQVGGACLWRVRVWGCGWGWNNWKTRCGPRRACAGFGRPDWDPVQRVKHAPPATPDQSPSPLSRTLLTATPHGLHALHAHPRRPTPPPQTSHQGAAVLGLALIAMAEPLGGQMAGRLLEHLLQVGGEWMGGWVGGWMGGWVGGWVGRGGAGG